MHAIFLHASPRTNENSIPFKTSFLLGDTHPLVTKSSKNYQTKCNGVRAKKSNHVWKPQHHSYTHMMLKKALVLMPCSHRLYIRTLLGFAFPSPP